MKNSELLDQWMSRLGQRTSSKIRADFVGEINSAIVDLERKPFIPWFLEKKAVLSVTKDDLAVALPVDFSLERENTRPYFILNGTVFYMRKQVAGTVFGFTTTNTRPIVYSLVGQVFEFRPVADQAYSINFYYYARTGGGFLDDGSTVSSLWLLNAPEWVFYKSAKIVARAHLQNQPLAADFAGLEVGAKRDLYNYHEAREHQNQDYEVGGISDGS